MLGDRTDGDAVGRIAIGIQRLQKPHSVGHKPLLGSRITAGGLRQCFGGNDGRTAGYRCHIDGAESNTARAANLTNGKGNGLTGPKNKLTRRAGQAVLGSGFITDSFHSTVQKGPIKKGRGRIWMHGGQEIAHLFQVISKLFHLHRSGTGCVKTDQFCFKRHITQGCRHFAIGLQ